MTADNADPASADSGVLAVLASNHGAFRRFLESRVESREAAEDILQEGFVRAAARVGSLRREESAVAWFYRSLRRAVIDHYRRRATAERRDAALTAELETAAVAPAQWRQEICRCVLRLAATLKPEYAEALQRIEIDDLSVGEYAAERGLSPANAAVRVFRARRALARQVAISCRTCAEHGCLDCDCSPPTHARAAP